MRFLSEGRALHERYVGSAPFPHVVLDDVLDGDLAARALGDVRSIPDGKWLRDDHAEQVGKSWIPTTADMPPAAREIVGTFSSPAMLTFMSELTGIPGLTADPELLGGGIHRTVLGGRLGVHADFNIHPVTGLHRRVNALLFLNPGWREEWNGHLELWNRDVTACVEKIAPIQNRLVVMTITDGAFHGHPQPLLASERLSMAFYYYSVTRPAHEVGPFHWADWRRTR